MAELFGIDKSGISRHIANIFKDEELQQDTTVAKIATVVNRGIRGEVEENYYATTEQKETEKNRRELILKSLEEQIKVYLKSQNRLL